MWDSGKFRAMLSSYYFLQQLMLKIISWRISLCVDDVLNYMIILNGTTRGNT